MQANTSELKHTENLLKASSAAWRVMSDCPWFDLWHCYCRGLLGTCLTIAREEGAGALWKGLEPGIYKLVLVCIYWASMAGTSAKLAQSASSWLRLNQLSAVPLPSAYLCMFTV